MGKNILTATFIISFFSLVSRVVGLLRDRILAGQFGASSELDIYYAAFKIPDFLYQIFVAGVLSAVFIPIFIDHLKNSEEESWRFTRAVASVFFIILSVAAIIFIIFTPFLMPIIAPGFTGEKRLLTIMLARIMFFSPLFLGFSAILASILQAHKRFFIFSLSPIFYNFGIILGALFFVPKIGLVGLAWGVVLGAFLHFAIQVPSVWKLGFRFNWLFDFAHQGLRQMFKLALPRIFSLAISQINIWVITAIASTLSVGTIAVFNLAQNLQNIPVGLIGIPFAIAVFPTLARLNDEKKVFKETINKTIFQILVFAIPIAIVFYFFSESIIKIILGAGKFSIRDVSLTAKVLSIFAFGLIGDALTPILVRGFYAFKDTFTPVLISIGSIVLNISSVFYFMQFFQSQPILALPLAFSISNIVSAFFLYFFLRKKFV